MTAIASLALNLNGNKLLLSLSGNGQIDGKEISVAPRTHAFLAGQKGVNGQIIHPWENYWEVSTNEFSLTIVRSMVDHTIQKEGWVYYGENCLDGYFNIKVEDKNITSPLHGLLGQTAHHLHTEIVDNKDSEGKGEIEGSYKDYIVGGPFENIFKFNLFKGN